MKRKRSYSQSLITSFFPNKKKDNHINPFQPLSYFYKTFQTICKLLPVVLSEIIIKYTVPLEWIHSQSFLYDYLNKQRISEFILFENENNKNVVYSYQLKNFFPQTNYLDTFMDLSACLYGSYLYFVGFKIEDLKFYSFSLNMITQKHSKQMPLNVVLKIENYKEFIEEDLHLYLLPNIFNNDQPISNYIHFDLFILSDFEDILHWMKLRMCNETTTTNMMQILLQETLPYSDVFLGVPEKIIPLNYSVWICGEVFHIEDFFHDEDEEEYEAEECTKEIFSLREFEWRPIDKAWTTFEVFEQSYVTCARHTCERSDITQLYKTDKDNILHVQLQQNCISCMEHLSSIYVDEVVSLYISQIRIENKDSHFHVTKREDDYFIK